jgi:hypothetical protein
LIHDDGEAEKFGKFVERLTDDGVRTAMVVIAPHGDLIEEYADHQAERVAAELQGISCWRCKGWNPRWRSLRPLAYHFDGHTLGIISASKYDH